MIANRVYRAATTLASIGVVDDDGGGGASAARSRWAMTAGVGVTELVSWGVLVYAFSAFVVPMRLELGWSPGTFTSVYTAASLLSGLVAVPVGRVLGLGAGQAELLRGTLLVSLYGPDEFPRVNGVVSGFVVAGRGAGPFVSGLVVTATGSYTPALVLAAALALLAAATLPVGLRCHRDEPAP